MVAHAFFLAHDLLVALMPPMLVPLHSILRMATELSRCPILITLQPETFILLKKDSKLIAGKSVDKFAGKSVDKFVGKSVDKFVGKSVDKFAGKSVDKFAMAYPMEQYV